MLIREQLAQSGQRLPWGDLWGFAQECSARMQAQLADSARHGRCFFDRGLPDLIGYLSHGGQTAPDAWRAASRAYAPVVFFAPPWREIYVNDAERPQTFAEACRSLSAHIRRAYVDCGFRLVDLVAASYLIASNRSWAISTHSGMRPTMGELTFITGPVRSGKSQRAVEHAKIWGSDMVFVATCANDVWSMPNDGTAQRRASRRTAGMAHRSEAPPRTAARCYRRASRHRRRA